MALREPEATFTPSMALKAMTFPRIGVSWTLESSTPLPPFDRAVPSALAPMMLRRTRLPEPLFRRMPSPPLPLMRFPVPDFLPPMALPDEPT